jgi:FkbM family methyltransferase
MAAQPTLRRLRGAFERWRRRVRTAVLRPLLIGNRTFRETVMNAVADRGHLIYCRTGDLAFFVDPGDRAVGAELVWGGEWARAELNRAVDVLRSAGRLPIDAVFVDAGANIGTQTVYALSGGAFARAVCFEPEPKNAGLLTMNVETNGFATKATIIRSAVGDVAGSAILQLHPRNKGNHMIGRAPSVDGLEQLEVPIVRMDEALSKAGVDPAHVGVVWIDVEGYEPQAIAGLGVFLDHKVPIVIEYSPSRYSAADQAALSDLLERHYRFYRDVKRLDQEHPIAELRRVTTGFNDVLVY